MRTTLIVCMGAALSAEAFAQSRHAAGVGAQAQVVTFVEIANSAGVTGPQLGLDHGSVFADFNRDGLLDICFTQKQARNYLYINQGNGTFSEQANAAGLNTRSGASERIRGTTVADYDNDGDLDLFFCSGDRDVLYRNNGNLTFTDVSSSAGVDNSGNGLVGTWGDYDRDGYVDLYVSNWDNDAQALYHNNRDGTFDDVTVSAGLGYDEYTNIGLWLDYDNDGDLDIFASRWNNQPHRLWRNNGDGSFTNVAAQAGVENTVKGQGAATADYDNDGDLDIYLGSDLGANLLFRNNGNGTFTEVGAQAGVDDARRTVDCAMGDFDNDGWVDIYTGNYNAPNGLYFNNGNGTFTEVGGVTADYARTIGTTLGDYDNDGDLDMYTGNSDEFNRLYDNQGNGNHWLQIELEGTTSNRSAIGARLEITAGGASPRQLREVSGGSGYCNQHALIQSVGLGASTLVQSLVIKWPSGAVETYTNIPVDQKIEFVEGQTPGPDTTPPSLSNIQAGALTSSSAAITWNTDEPANSQVEYGLSASYGNTTTLDTTLTLAHAQTLSGLQANTTYHYRVRSSDASGNLATSSDRTFTTLPSQAADVSLYERLEQAMTNTTSFANPFTETELRLDVTTPAGRARGSSFTWYGFHDGNGQGGQSGNVWKFRMLFDHPGTWTVVAGFYVPGTNTSNGPSQTFTYNVSANKFPGEHGHVRADQQNFRRLRHDDGTPWTPFAMHSSMLLDRNQTLAFDWIDEHAALGVNALMVRFHAESNVLGDPYRPHFLQNGSTWDYDRYNISTWRYNDQIIAYAQSKGVKLAIWFGISGLNPQYGSYGPTDYPNNTTLGPQQKAFIKYFLARWAPFTCFWHWTVDSEYEEGGSGALDRNRTYAAELGAKNPWATIVTTHTIGNWSPGNAPEFDLATLQRRVADTDQGATDCRTFITSNDDYGIPVFNSEGVWSLSNVTRSRIATWSHLMAGGFSEIAHEDTDGTHNTSSWGVNWNSVNPRHREDAAEMGKLAIFFNNAPGSDLNACVPHNELVTVQNGNLALCLADPGESYFIWLDRGGAPTLNLAGVSGNFSVKRYRCTNLTTSDSLAPIAGGGNRTLQTTPTTGFGNDYLYVVQRTAVVSPAITVITPNGGETWASNGTATVTWSSIGAIANVKIDLSTDGGLSFPFTLANNTANDGVELINVPQVVTTQGRVRVSDAGNNAVADLSDGNFAISVQVDTTAPLVKITTPANDGQSFKGKIAVSGTATDNAGISHVAWQLDSTTGIWNVATGTNAWSFNISQPSEGSHTVFVQASDAATPSNTSAPVARTFIADNTGPVISNLHVNASQTTATVTWNTNEPSNSRVQWGTAPNNYTNDTGVVETGVTSHTVTLNNLTASTTYHYIVMSSDAVNNLSISSDATFQTSSPPPLTGTFKWESDPNSGANTFDEAIITIVVTELNATQLQAQATANLFYGSGDNDYMLNPYVRLDNVKQYVFLGKVGGQNIVQPNGKSVPYTVALVFNKPASGAWYLGYENYYDASHAATTNKGGEESGPLGQVADTLAPAISNVAATNVSANAATITWNTNEPSDSQVEYGLTASYGNSSLLDPTLALSHLVNLTGLLPGTTYHYRVQSRDASGNLGLSGDQTFTTAPLSSSGNVAFDNVQGIFDRNCVRCHQGNPAPAGLALLAGQSYNNLVNVPSTEYPQWLRVDPGKRAVSWLYEKITNANPAVGSKMENLTPDETDLIGTWIDQGAAQTPAPPYAELQFRITSLPLSEINIAYDVELIVWGGLPPYQYSLVAGALAPGLTLNTSTGHIAGAPTATGTYNFTVRVQDSQSPSVSLNQAYALEVRDTQASWQAPANFQVEAVVTDVDLPMNIAFVPNPGPNAGDPYFYVTSLYGEILMVQRDFQKQVYASNLLNFDPRSTPKLDEIGVDGIAVDPVTGDVFATIPYDQNGTYYNKVVRFHSTDGGRTAATQTAILSDIPVTTSHFAHAVTIGPDGKLYVNVGDGQVPSAAADENDLRGKILRMNFDGTLPGDNPFPNSYAYALGLRNPFGADWRAQDGRLYVSDNGQGTNDRLIKVTSGGDYGWPNNLTQGAIYLWNPTVAPVAVDFLEGAGFPSNYQGQLFVGWSGPTYALGATAQGKKIEAFELDGAGNVLSNSIFLDYVGAGYATVIGVAFGPDGLYFTDLYGENGFDAAGYTHANVYRVRWVSSDTIPPTINSVQATNIFDAGATIVWQTDELAKRQVEYGVTPAYGQWTAYETDLQTNHSVTLTGLTPQTTYHYRVWSWDASNNGAVSADFTFTTTARDTVTPVIGNVDTSNVSPSGATISWNTNEPADSQVEYGLTASYGSLTALDPTLVTNHSVALAQLTPNATYHYRVHSKDAAGNKAISGDFTFQTPAAGDSALLGTFTWQSDPNSGVNTFDEAILTIVVTELNATQLQAQATANLFYGSGDNDYMLNPYVRLDNVKQYVFLGKVGGQNIVQPNGKSVPYTVALVFNKPASGAWYLGYENYYDASHASTTNKGGEESGPLAQVADTLAPVISSVAATNVSANAATISWNTNEPADSQVEYGLTVNYGSLTTLNPALVTNHAVALSQLASNSTYHYRVHTKDAAGNKAISRDFTFQTLTAGGSDLTGTFTWESDPNSGANTFDEAILKIVVTELNATQLQVQATADLLYGPDDNDYMLNPYVRLNTTKQYIFAGQVGGQSLVLPNGKVVPYTVTLVFTKPASGSWYLGYENYYDGSHVSTTNKGAEESGPLAPSAASQLAKADVKGGDPSERPRDFALSQNYPNPFNIETRVNLDLPEHGRVQAVIYNLQGQEVRRLHDEMFHAGSHMLQWNGANTHGETMSSGVYLLRVVFERESGAREVATRRLVVMK